MITLEQLKGFNPWWENPQFRFPQAGIIERGIFRAVEPAFNAPQIVSLLGLRRCGKTTVMNTYLNKVLNQQKDRSTVFFFSFEDYLGKNDPDVLNEILETYFQKYLRKNIWEIQEPLFIFLDEIQYIEHWQDILKRFYDRNKRLKFLISGSFSAALRKGSTESLAGRIFEVTVPLFSFHEYTLLKKVLPDMPIISVKELGDLFQKNNEEKIANLQRFIELHRTPLELFYKEYLYKGQFPETIAFADDRLINAYLKGSILKKLLVEDAPKVFKIDKIEEFATLYRILSRETGNLFEILNLAREIAINKLTLNNYLFYLDQLYLLKIVYNHTKKLREQYRIHKKTYVASPNFTCNELDINDQSPLFESLVGNLVETVIFQLLSQNYLEVTFWREREKEVDFIVEDKGEMLPIEVKYVNKLSPKHLGTLRYIIKKRKLSRGIVITKNEAWQKTYEGASLIALPAWCLV